MQEKIYTLPEYPVSEDLWDRLAAEARPIVIYGMGNGADKLFDRLAEYGVTPADIFASDGFVRGHSFRGMRVKSFSEIKEEYSDFVILLAFASNRPEVIEMLGEINGKYEMYIPDMPVAGEEEYFDREFYNSNYAEIKSAYESLCDERSRSLFASIVRYKLTGKMELLMDNVSEKEDLYKDLPRGKIEKIIDVGAYNGDTLREARCFFPHLKHAIAIEPDRRTFRRLMKYVERERTFEIEAVNASAWCDSAEGIFISSGNRNSSVSSTASYENRAETTRLMKIDDLSAAPDYIKYDVEGAELEALIGSRETVRAHRPVLLVSLYHRSRDLFSLINYLRGEYPDYRMLMHRLPCVPAWEIDLLLLPGIT